MEFKSESFGKLTFKYASDNRTAKLHLEESNYLSFDLKTDVLQLAFSNSSMFLNNLGEHEILLEVTDIHGAKTKTKLYITLIKEVVIRKKVIVVENLMPELP
jgi:hypothetical protein